MARLASLVALALALPFSVHAAQGPDPDGTKPADPHALSGVWMNDMTLDEILKREGRKRLDAGENPLPERAVPKLTPAYREIYEQRKAAKAKLAEGTETCEWVGMPRIMTYPYPLEILETPGRITMIFEADSQVRRIFMDRKEHLPDDELDPTYNGDSIGHWEGDTLVVDTIGFNDRTELPGGWPHSDQMHIVERIHYIDGDTIKVETTVTDPLALEEPLESTLIFSKRPDWRIREYSCLDNNRDAPDASGQRVAGVVE